MLKKILLVAAVVTVPVVVYTAIQHGQVKSVSFNEALQIAAGQSDVEKAPGVMIRGQVISNHDHAQSGVKEFTLRDANMVDFPVSYTGAEEVSLQHMQTVAVVGHVHGEGTSAYFHASEIIFNY